MLVYYRQVAKELVPPDTPKEFEGEAWREAERKVLAREPYVSLGHEIVVHNSYYIREQLKSLGFKFVNKVWRYTYRDRADADNMIRKLHALPCRIVYESDRIDQILSK